MEGAYMSKVTCDSLPVEFGHVGVCVCGGGVSLFFCLFLSLFPLQH